MQPTPSEWVNLTPESGHFLFGYYDRCPWDAAGRRHLALRIPQQERLPVPGETADVGYIDRDERRFVKLTDTRAWCHQQGAMTQWLAHLPDAFVFNDFRERGGKWQPVARVLNSSGKELGDYEMPVYVLSRDGRLGASLNFGRIPRRGYSYAIATCPYEQRLPELDNDGLFLVDMPTGKTRLLVSYRQFLTQHPFPYDVEGQYVWLNHAIFNSDASRVMVLFRHCADPRQPWPWRTHLFTVGTDGTDLRCPLHHVYWGNGAISHQMWGRTPDELLVDANWFGRGHEYITVSDRGPGLQAKRISSGMGPMGHLMFSPDGRWLAADTYPDDAGLQRLALVELATGQLTEIGRFRHQTPGAVGDMRCDLHPRWSADSRRLTVDTLELGERKILVYELPR